MNASPPIARLIAWNILLILPAAWFVSFVVLGFMTDKKTISKDKERTIRILVIAVSMALMNLWLYKENARFANAPESQKREWEQQRREDDQKYGPDDQDTYKKDLAH